MMQRCLVLLVLAAVLAVPVARAEEAKAEMVLAQVTPADPALDGVTKAILEKWGTVSSMSASLDGQAIYNASSSSQPQAQAVTLLATGSIDYVKKDDKLMSRLDLSSKFAQTTSDVEFAHVLAVVNGDEGAAKVTLLRRDTYYDLPKAPAGASDQMVLDLLRKYFSLKVMPEEKIGDEDAYVLEGTPTFSVPDDWPIRDVKACFSKENGAPLQITVYNPNGEAALDMRFSNIKLNADISESVFAVPVEPPKPVPAPDPAAAAPATEEKKEDAPKAAEGEPK
ncbi:MAG TPA: hypothetical protein PLO37_09860 [Candidatus Hydrogenedentes bacterium]|mgnify:CR=1 FL=1|nr:hypothetical protein [Candidatus Hydrogenedentota bacterium]HPG67138.1 hypothetical protein [Candidatus Hydrogenedentota bacterium]